MEIDKKEHLYNDLSLIRFSSDNGVNTCTVNIKKVIFGLWLIMEILLYVGNIYVPCKKVFQCAQYFPSLSYAQYFHGLDRFVTASISFYTATLIFYHISVYISVMNVVNKFISIGLLILGLLSTATLPLITITSEINSDNVIDVENFHAVTIWCFIIMHVVQGVLTQLLLSFKIAQQKKQQLHIKIFQVIVALLLLTYFYIYLSLPAKGEQTLESYTDHNLNVIGAILLMASAMLPAVYAQQLNDLVFVFTTDGKDPDNIELTKF